MSVRIAIVGAGPAGFYAAEQLLKAPALEGVQVDLLDRLPTPWGLVRAGVAPDHPNIKAVSRVFTKTAALPGFRFLGNVEVGRDVSHEELLATHHAVIYTTGVEADRRMGIPGEELAGSTSAREFVAWYNGHPDYADLEFDLSGPRAVVVGNGNVALDVARMLVLTREELAVTDVADHALEALASSTIEEVVVLGRRGCAQAAYTTPELRELGELADADVVVDSREIALDEGSRLWLEGEGTPTARRNVEVVTALAERAPQPEKRKRVVLRFLASPTEVLGTDRVEAVRIGRNALVPAEGGGLRAVATGEQEVVEASLLLRAVGYRGTPVPGVPFDERSGTIPNAAGRVLDPESGDLLPGVYAAGWIKRGPSGVIGTNKKDAAETTAALLADAAAGLLPEPAEELDAFDALLAQRRPDAVDHEGWLRIDERERGAGEAQGRPRVKLVRVPELLDAAASVPAAATPD